MSSSIKGKHAKRISASVSQPDSFDMYTGKSPAHKVGKSGVSPSPGKKKREEAGSDWKQVTNKK